MITLNATLATAQSYIGRKPLVEIVSAQRGDDIPFDGQLLTTETFNEYSPSVIAHSSGRLALAYVYGPDGDGHCGIKYVYTDASRTEFTTVTIKLYLASAYVMKSVSICEMSDGNIGIIALVNDGVAHVYRLLRRIITVTGEAVSNAEIANWSHDTFTADAWCATLATNSYITVYGKASGADYYLYKQTSSNFSTWATESQLSIAGLTSTWELDNPSLIRLTTGDIWLWFDALESTGPSGEQLKNVYYSASANSGATWSTATKITNYATYSEIGIHPTACQKVADQLHLLFTKQAGALHMTDTATGWPIGSTSVELSWDSVNRRLYVVNVYSSGGEKYLQNVVRINVDTWEADAYWDETTTPGFPSFLTDGTSTVGYNIRVHDGHHIVIFVSAANARLLWHLDGENNTITNYYLDDVPAWSAVKNVTHSIDDISAYLSAISSAHVDITNNKIYLYFLSGYVWDYRFYVGYIDLTESGSYQLHQVLNFDASEFTSDEWESINIDGGFYVDVPGNRILIHGGSTLIVTQTGVLAVFDIVSGAEIYKWEGQGVDGDFPYFGISKPFVYEDKIFAGMISYTAGYSQSTFRGLVEIDLNTEVIKYHRPSYCSIDDHFFNRPAYIGDNRLAMVHANYGVAIYNMIDESWQLISNTTLPGLTIDGSDALSVNTQIQYDATNDIIFVGDPRDAANGNGVIAFMSEGFIRQSYYSIGAFSGGAWTFATADQLVQGVRDYESVGVADPSSSGSMYVFWTNETVDAEKSIKWDRDGSSLNLSAYIIDEEISISRSIDGTPALLNFTASSGHLFDPYNQDSLLSIYLKKGRKLTVRWGEKISGVDYWQNAGNFFVTKSSMSLERGQYPSMKIEAADQRVLWQHSHVYATSIYSNYPEDIITDLAEDVAGIALADIDLPVFDNRQIINHQWIETPLDEILTQLCDRFGYYYRFDCDGKLSARKITNAGTVTNIYSDLTKIINYTPDDSYSDFTNRVTVIGQETDFTQVQFAEERISQVSGTLGWWGCSKEHVVWFSDDKSRRAIEPRMEAIETSVSIPFKLAGSVKEYLSEGGPGDDNKFCVVNVEAPNLIAALAAAIGLYEAAYIIPDLLNLTAAQTVSVGRKIEGVALMAALMILGSVANYQLEVWAKPLGSIRRTVQGQWNDEAHQTEIGAIIEKKFEDPLCYSVFDCNLVAAFDGMVAQMQRKRVKITKVANLKDEDGDTIRFLHPYSNKSIDLFITNIKRRYKKANQQDKDGYFLDDIEGWVVNQ